MINIFQLAVGRGMTFESFTNCGSGQPFQAAWAATPNNNNGRIVSRR
jgi:hypothetical protein